jgi:ABC-type antimicrobial peptide transport system permease subunit
MFRLFEIFAGIAIFIGCLGLFGLTVFMVNQKTKEIGVRKVLGASVENILFLFSREFVRLILVAFMLAAPVGWYFSTKYLEQFAYKISIGPSVFVLGLGSTFLIAFVTVGYRSIKAAMINPALALRSE